MGLGTLAVPGGIVGDEFASRRSHLKISTRQVLHFRFQAGLSEGHTALAKFRSHCNNA